MQKYLQQNNNKINDNAYDDDDDVWHDAATN